MTRETPYEDEKSAQLAVIIGILRGIMFSVWMIFTVLFSAWLQGWN